jgi:hypothetical protein
VPSGRKDVPLGTRDWSSRTVEGGEGRDSFEF